MLVPRACSSHLVCPLYRLASWRLLIASPDRVCCLQDPDLHLKHLKQSPPTQEIIDNCIECGFCESNCPSKDVTLTPRQRITTLREQARLKSMPSLTPGQQARCAHTAYQHTACVTWGCLCTCMLLSHGPPVLLLLITMTKQPACSAAAQWQLEAVPWCCSHAAHPVDCLHAPASSSCCCTAQHQLVYNLVGCVSTAVPHSEVAQVYAWALK